MLNNTRNMTNQSALRRRVVKDVDMTARLTQPLTDQINDCALFMPGIDVSYDDEDYSEFKIEGV